MPTLYTQSTFALLFKLRENLASSMPHINITDGEPYSSADGNYQARSIILNNSFEIVCTAINGIVPNNPFEMLNLNHLPNEYLYVVAQNQSLDDVETWSQNTFPLPNNNANQPSH